MCLPVHGEIMMIQQLFVRALALFYVIATISIKVSSSTFSYLLNLFHTSHHHQQQLS